MDVLSFRDYCLSLPLTEESTPFDETTLVYKIGGKMYACADMNDFGQVAVKCDPDEAVRLRERYEEIGPAYHFNKTHWNGIRTAGDLPDAFIREQITADRTFQRPGPRRMGVRHRPGGRRRRPGCLLRAEREYPHSGQSVRVHAHGGDLRRLPASR